MFQYFNTTKGIAKAVVDLSSLQVLINDRRNLRKENLRGVLNEFVLWGWIILDEFGQVNFIDQIIQKQTFADISSDIRRDFPSVVSMTEFKKQMKKMNVDHWQISVTNYQRRIPFHSAICPCCKQPWTLKNAHDVVSEDHTFFVNEIDSYISRDVRREIAIDLAARSSIAEGDFDAPMFIVSKLSEITRANWTVGVQDGKVQVFTRHDLYHNACYQQVLHKTKCQEFEKVFRAAGINLFGQIRTKNEYGSETWMGPWFIFDTEYGLIKVGWRKRVIAVDYRFINRDYLVNSDETRGPGYEHVEGYTELEIALRNFVTYLKQHQFTPEIPSLVHFARGTMPALDGVLN